MGQTTREDFRVRTLEFMLTIFSHMNLHPIAALDLRLIYICIIYYTNIYMHILNIYIIYIVCVCVCVKKLKN